MRVILFVLFAMLVGCGDSAEPVVKAPRDDYLVQLTCDKDAPDYTMQTSRKDYAFFVGHPLRDGEPVPDVELREKYDGWFHYRTADGWARCPGNNDGTSLAFGFNGYNQRGCNHSGDKPVELIVWLPASMDDPSEIDPSLGCTPTVGSPK